MKRGRGRGRALSREPGDDVLKAARTEAQSSPNPSTSASAQPQPSTSAIAHLSPSTSRVATPSASASQSPYTICDTRPPGLNSKKGTSGQPITIQTNFFRLEKTPSWSLYQYRVDFTPNVVNSGLRKALIAQQRPNFGCGYLFDGTLLYLSKKLPAATDPIIFQSKSREEDTYEIVLKFTSVVSMKTSASLQILNLILRKAMQGLKLQLVARNYYDAAAKIDIRGEFNIELWPGYTTSIRQHESDLLICCEVAHKVMRTDTVYDNMQRIQREERDFQSKFLTSVLGQTVLTAYNNRTYRIDDIDFSKTPQSTFEWKKEGKTTTFIEYFRTRYQINIRDVNQPLLVSMPKARDVRGGNTDPILLIPELCRSTGLTETMRNNFRFMKSMDPYTRMNPPARIRKLLDFNKRLNSCDQSVTFLQEWQTKLDDQLVELPGRLLKSQQILWGNGILTQTNREADWTNDLRNQKMYRSVELKRWYILVTERGRREASDFVNVLMDAARGLQFVMTRPREKIIADDRLHTYVEALEECAAQNPQMMVCIVSNNNADRYGAIKKKCCIDRPIPTQVIVQRTITPKGGNVRGLLSIATKIAIQMNCKLGGAPWTTPIPLSGLMAIGFDVGVDCKDKRRSYGALVASMDMKQTAQYFSAVASHSSGEELSTQLTLNVVKALRAYQGLHNALPQRICIYRSGVGDGHLKYVVEQEVKQLVEKLNDIYESAGAGKCKMSFIVVSTRIDARFFVNGNNPLPGTVVDDVVTLPERYDFYLVPQSVRQGTVSATNFNVIYDQMELEPDKLQLLSYKLTHLYYNWSGTVRVPAVCKYASKLAFLVSQFLHQAPNHALEKELFFL